VQAEIIALMNSIGHKFGVESDVVQHTDSTFTAFEYSYDLTHPWLREFSYRIDIFTDFVDAGVVVPEIKKYLSPDNREHVVFEFCEQWDLPKQAYKEFGYQLAWSNVIMGRHLESSEMERFQGVKNPFRIIASGGKRD